MQDFKGTPGPWKVNTIGQHWNNKSLTHIEVTFGFEGECVCDTVYEMANANLIAAAPELLEALQLIIKDLRIRAKVRGDIDDDGTVVLDIGSGALMKANDAIAKALGQ